MKILAIDDNLHNLTALEAVVEDRLPGATLLAAVNGEQGAEFAPPRRMERGALWRAEFYEAEEGASEQGSRSSPLHSPRSSLLTSQSSSSPDPEAGSIGTGNRPLLDGREPSCRTDTDKSGKRSYKRIRQTRISDP